MAGWNRAARWLALGLCGWLVLSTPATAVADGVEQRARTLAERWLALLDHHTLDRAAYAPLLADSGLDLQLIEGQAQDLAQLSALLKTRFQGLLHSRSQITYLRTEPQADGRLRLWMELEWQGEQDDGLPARARLQIHWLLEAQGDGTLRIKTQREHYLAPLQGNGARIKC